MTCIWSGSQYFFTIINYPDSQKCCQVFYKIFITLSGQNFTRILLPPNLLSHQNLDIFPNLTHGPTHSHQIYLTKYFSIKATSLTIKLKLTTLNYFTIKSNTGHIKYLIIIYHIFIYINPLSFIYKTKRKSYKNTKFKHCHIPK